MKSVALCLCTYAFLLIFSLLSQIIKIFFFPQRIFNYLQSRQLDTQINSLIQPSLEVIRWRKTPKTHQAEATTCLKDVGYSAGKVEPN